nr:MAG TPA: hypothetical protein [Caudoviricetes sp.]
MLNLNNLKSKGNYMAICSYFGSYERVYIITI